MDKKGLFLLLVLVIVITVVIGIVQNTGTSSVGSLSNDFKNEKLVSSSSTVLPEHIRERFESDLAKHIEGQETEENPFFAYLGEATTIRQLGDFNLALEKLGEVEERYPENYLVSLNKGTLLVDMHQYLSAAISYGEAIKKKPIEILPHLKLADLYRQHSSNPLGAENVYIRALVETNSNKEILKNYAGFLSEEKQDYELSISYWERALKETISQPLREAIKKEIRELQALLVAQ